MVTAFAAALPLAAVLAGAFFTAGFFTEPAFLVTAFAGTEAPRRAGLGVEVTEGKE